MVFDGVCNSGIECLFEHLFGIVLFVPYKDSIGPTFGFVDEKTKFRKGLILGLVSPFFKIKPLEPSQ
jgi:hypothetical protein